MRTPALPATPFLRRRLPRSLLLLAVTATGCAGSSAPPPTPLAAPETTPGIAEAGPAAATAPQNPVSELIQRLERLAGRATVEPCSARCIEETAVPPEAPHFRGRTGDGAAIEFALAHTRVLADIEGNLARVEVQQLYQNPGPDRLEAVYAFPLPENAAVTDMVFRIGDRIVRSEVKKRDEARATYERARSEGRTAALTEQERPNLFTQSVANIPPGASVEVVIRYVHEVPFLDGRYRFVFPTTVGPRYLPGLATGHAGGGTSPDTDRVSDGSRVTPPIVPAGYRSAHDLELIVRIAPGDAFQEVQARAHRILIGNDPGSDGTRHDRLVTLAPEDDRIPNRDFVLSYRPAGREPEARLLYGPATARESTAAADGDGFFLLFVQPPAEIAPAMVRPKEMVFLVDKSGSMMGRPLDTARQLIVQALRHMGEDDTFQIVAFDSAFESMSPSPLSNTRENVAQAERFLGGLQGGGGTEMLAGVRAALEPPEDPRRLRMVVFCTDGFIGNESEIIDLVGKRRGGARVFGFGIGSSVNRYLIEGVSRAGRGVAEFVDSGEDPAQAVQRLYRRLDRPVLTDLSLSLDGARVSGLEPEQLPDLFAGQPLTVAGRMSGGVDKARVILRGRLGSRDYEKRMTIDPIAPPTAVLPGTSLLGTLWARRRIEDLGGRFEAGATDRGKDEITRLGLDFHLVTAFTSFVAVDRKLHVSPSVPLAKMLVPGELAEGVSREGLGGVSGDGEAAQVDVLPMRVKPGDPEIRVLAGPTARAVRVTLPFDPAGRSPPPSVGESGREAARMGTPIDAVFDPARGDFTARFLVPPGYPDGTYEARIEILHEGGRVEEQRAPIRVDTTPASIAVVRPPTDVRAGRAFTIGLKPSLSIGAALATVVSPPPGGAGPALRGAMEVSEVMVRAPWGEIALAEMRGPLGIWDATLHVPEGTRSGPLRLEVVSSDGAGNVSRRFVEVEVGGARLANGWAFGGLAAGLILAALLGGSLLRRRVRPTRTLRIASAAVGAGR